MSTLESVHFTLEAKIVLESWGTSSATLLLDHLAPLKDRQKIVFHNASSIDTACRTKAQYYQSV